MLCDIKNALCLPMTFDIQATIGITINVVHNAPILPKSTTQTPVATASPSNNLYTITKNVRAATVLKELKIKKVEKVIEKQKTKKIKNKC